MTAQKEARRGLTNRSWLDDELAPRAPWLDEESSGQPARGCLFALALCAIFWGGLIFGLVLAR